MKDYTRLTEISPEPIRFVTFAGEGGLDLHKVVTREWLITNGIGGYASGTVSGVLTRRYHGLLVASLPCPSGRIVMLSSLIEEVITPAGNKIRLSGEERVESFLQMYGTSYLVHFQLEAGLPLWRFEIDGFVLERRIFLSYRQNTVNIHYSLISGSGDLKLRLSPAVNFRPHEDAVCTGLTHTYSLRQAHGGFVLSAGKDFPRLRMTLKGEDGKFSEDGRKIVNVLYRREEMRGYEKTGDLWSPGYFEVNMRAGSKMALIGSVESWDMVNAIEPDYAVWAERDRRVRMMSLAPADLKHGFGAELCLAADQFVITPVGRVTDLARAHAAGDEVRTVVAGYHWFTDWGRDTMISLEGLTLVTGRFREAAYILRTFSHYIRNGLIPNMFPEGGREGLYHTADATLWMFHALDRYLAYTGDTGTLRYVYPSLVRIIECHLRGTDFNIGADPGDSLIGQGETGYALTWMDAKVGDWVVTPRRGKTVEINALWYNALRLMQEWTEDLSGPEDAACYGAIAGKVTKSFNERFWNPERGFLYDIVDGEQGNDPSCRPNQIFAIALRHPVLDEDRWPPVLDVVTRELLTPFGLRSLSQDNPDYKKQYFGDRRARDAAYHQGTVWAWLIGPYIDAWIRVNPQDRLKARTFLEAFIPHLGEAGIGSISEVFDAEPPFTPHGCISQAWSVAEVLRAWAKTAG